MPALSPTVRWLLTGLVGAATAAVSILSDGFQPLDVLLVLIALGGALGLIPPQTGGTQNGVVNPSITEPPDADVRTTYGGPGAEGGTLPMPGEKVYGNQGIVALAPMFLVNEVSGNDVERWIGFALVVGFLIAAGVALFRYSNYLAAGGLAILALISGVLLL